MVRDGRVSRRIWLSASIVSLVLAATAYAQFGYRGDFYRVPPRYAQPDTFDGRFNFCRVMYRSWYREAGGTGWSTDYPGADINLSIRLSELTKAPVNFDREGEPRFVVVPIMDPALFRCPWAILEDGGTATFDDDEVRQLRNYFLKGGFVWLDDFWGTRAWDNWQQQIAKILPSDRYPIVDIPPDHMIYRTLFEVRKIPQIPSIQFWRQSGGLRSERGSDSATVHFRGIVDDHGRLIVLMTHNTDIADGWEREGEDVNFFYAFSPDSYALAINIMMYGMSH